MLGRTRAKPKKMERLKQSSSEVSIEDCVKTLRLGHDASYHYMKDVTNFQNDLLSWYDRAQRTNMPWRKPMNLEMTREEQSQRAYEVWVSEIMLQQTQVATVIDYYNRWMDAFPTIYDLASADIEQVNTRWAGLGYYSRARRIWEGARKVVQDLDGNLPCTAKELQREIPGVGPYTAGAVASIVFHERTPAVDGNVIRVLARTCAIGADTKKATVVDLFWDIARQIVPSARPGDFNQAMMELGARVCTPQNPKCDDCPVRNHCKALEQYSVFSQLSTAGFWNSSVEKKRRRSMDHDECEACVKIEKDMTDLDDYVVTRYPFKVDKKPPRDEECAVGIVQCMTEDEKPLFLISKRPDTGLLAGLWEFPCVELGSKATDAMERSQLTTHHLNNKYGIDTSRLAQLERKDLGNIVHLFSHIRKVYHVEWISYRAPCQPAVHDGKWISLGELKVAPIPTALKKALKILEKFQMEESKPSKSKIKAAPKRSSNTMDISKFFTKQS